MNMRNATCVRTQTSKDPTRVALLFISYSMPERQPCFYNTQNNEFYVIQAVPKNPQSIENNLLLEFQCLALS